MPGDTESEEREAFREWLRADCSSWPLSTVTVCNMQTAWLERARRARAEAEGLRKALRTMRACISVFKISDQTKGDCYDIIDAALAREPGEGKR